MAFGLLVVASTCLAEPYGVPVAGFPNANERAVWVLVNRARADPAAELASCTGCAEKSCYQVKPPVYWSYELNRAARFHAGNLVRSGSALKHDSPCTLVSDISAKYPPDGTCLGEPACACEGGVVGCGANGCNNFSSRVGIFGGFAWAENAAGGFFGPESVFYAWLYESSSSSACGFSYSNGHRYNILTKGPSLGVGFDGDWVQDFGNGGGTAKLVAGAYVGQRFLANWSDSAGGPVSAKVNVDGACTALALERGLATNGTWKAEVALGGGCSRYYFEFTDPAGTIHTLPEAGSYSVDCAEDWSTTRPPACSPDSGTPGPQDAGHAPDSGTPGPQDAGHASDSGSRGEQDAGAGTASPDAGALPGESGREGGAPDGQVPTAAPEAPSAQPAVVGSCASVPASLSPWLIALFPAAGWLRRSRRAARPGREPRVRPVAGGNRATQA